MRIAFFDHHDSFSHNLVALLEAQGARVDLYQDFKSGVLGSPMTLHRRVQAVVFSPGPGHPSHYPQSLELYRTLPARIPVLGVCLGHQLMLQAEGARVIRTGGQPVHGRRLVLKPRSSAWLGRAAYGGTFVFYNSLGVPSDDPVFSQTFHCLAAHEGFAVVVEHRSKPHVGVQFHPESFASTGGPDFIRAFLALVQRESESTKC